MNKRHADPPLADLPSMVCRRCQCITKPANAYDPYQCAIVSVAPECTDHKVGDLLPTSECLDDPLAEALAVRFGHAATEPGAPKQ